MTLIGQVIYFLIFLVFIQIAAEVLGIDQITELLNGLIAYLPLVIVALLVLFTPTGRPGQRSRSPRAATLAGSAP